MELHPDEPRVVGNFDDLRQHAVGRFAGEDQPRLRQVRLVGHVDLVAVPVTLRNLRLVVDSLHPGVVAEHAGVGAQTHGPALVRPLVPGFPDAVLIPFGHQADDGLFAGTELGGPGLLDAGQIARSFDHGHLHAEAYAEIGNAPLAGEPGRFDLAFGAPLAEAARHQDGVGVLQGLHRAAVLEDLALDPLEIDLDVVGDAAVGQGLGEGLVGILQAGVLADHGDGHLAFRLDGALGDVLPGFQIGLFCVIQSEMAADLPVEALGMIRDRHLINVLHVHRRNDRVLANVAEVGDLPAFAVRDGLLGTAQQQIGLDTDILQFADAVLGRFGLELSRRGDKGHQGHMDEHGLPAAEVVAQLPDGFQERQAFDVADRAADFTEDEILAVEVGLDEFLDGVGDVRDHLDGGAEIFAAALPGDDLGIDAARGDVVGLLGVHIGESLIVSEIEIGLRPVIGDVDLAVLVGAHGSRIDVDIGVELSQADLVAARLQERAQGRRSQSFTKG